MAEGTSGESLNSGNFTLPPDVLQAMAYNDFNMADFSLGDASLGFGSLPVGEPNLEILEQPKQRGFRFRYSCEGPSHGGLPGERSEKGKKSYPSVQINNYVGPARIEVTLVTASDPPKPHAHSLVGKNVVEGACITEVGPEQAMTASFPNLGIQHVTKKNVKVVLTERYIKMHEMEKAVLSTISSGNTNGLNQVQTGGETSAAGSSKNDMIRNTAEYIAREERKKIEHEVDEETKNMNLTAVRLKFQTYLPDEHGNFVRCLPPVYSNPIFDSKAATASELKICRMDRQAGFVNGGEEVFLLCDKVQKDGRTWEGFAKFSTSDVHRQYAIVFKTPQYWNTAIEKPVTVKLELRRKSDMETSNAVDFTYKPTEFDPEHIGAKRRKTVPHFDDYSDQPSTSSGRMGTDPGSAGAEGSGGIPQFDANMFAQFLNTMYSGGLLVPGGLIQQSQGQPPSQEH